MTNTLFKIKDTFAIGGLQNIGYVPGEDLLVVLSAQGQGIFDCLTGQRIARSNEEWYPKFNDKTFSVDGFDILSNTSIPTSGIYGGDRLIKSTMDNWKVTAKTKTQWKGLRATKRTKIYLYSPNNTAIQVGEDGPCELRAFGFSDTGKSFVIALSCELKIFSRESA